MICSKPTLYLVGLVLKDRPYSYKWSDFNSVTRILFQKSFERRECKEQHQRGSKPCLSSSVTPQLQPAAICSDTPAHTQEQHWLEGEGATREKGRVWDLKLVPGCTPPRGCWHSSASGSGGTIRTRLIIGPPSLLFSAMLILIDKAPGYTNQTSCKAGLEYPEANSLISEARVLAS